MLDKLKNGTTLDSARHGRRREGRDRDRAQARRHDAATFPPKVIDAVFHTAKDALRQRRGRQADAMDRVPGDRRQDAGARPEFGRRQEARSDCCSARSATTCSANTWPGWKTISAPASISRCWRKPWATRRAGYQMNADRAFGRGIRRALCGRRAAGRVDDAGRRPGNAGLRVPESHRRARPRNAAHQRADRRR